MKTLSLIFSIAFVSLNLFSQPNFEDAMHAALDQFGSAASVEELQAAAAQFERIAEVETTEWLPGYYASLIYCIISFSTENSLQKEAFINQAQLQLDKAMKIAPEESEIHALQGMLYQALMSADPAKYGQSLGPKANGAFQLAIKLNPENPRPYYLQGVSVMYTPEPYGGGKKAAVPLFEKAMELFHANTAENSLFPNWGGDDCEKNLKVCREEQGVS